MATIRTRAAKGSDLTPGEADANFEKTVRQVTTTASGLISDNRGTIEGNHATTPFTITLLAVATAAAAEPGDYSCTITNIGAAVVTVDANASETINGSTDTLTLTQYSSVTVELNSTGTGWQIVARRGYKEMLFSTAVATTSGTTHDFTGIPSGVSKIKIMFDSISTDGTIGVLIRLGDSGGFETTGYTNNSIRHIATTPSSSGNIGGFPIFVPSAATNIFSGIMELINISGNVWVGSWNCSSSVDTVMNSGAGRKELSGELTQIRLLTDAGADNFDAGEVNIAYE